MVLFGGRSAEHEVSCISAASVLAAVDPGRYDVVPVGITRDGRWLDARAAVAAQGPSAPSLPVAGPEIDPRPALAAAGPAPVVVLPLLHGPMGEDGTVQGLLELADVPYVGAGVLASAACMDKAFAKEVLARHGLPQVRWLTLRDVPADPAEVEARLGWPVFVKPANLGSSVGVTKAGGRTALAEAVELARGYDEWVVIEEAVSGRELEVGVLGNTVLDASVVGEIVPSREFYDYEDKYLAGGARLIVPADVPPEVGEEARRLAVLAAGVLRVEGMARVDFFYEAPGRGMLVNEVNTIPGFTPFSMFPSLWAATGLAYGPLVDRLVTLALERHAGRHKRVGRAR